MLKYKTISFMKDLNTLYIIYYYDPNNKVKVNTTRRVTIGAKTNNSVRKHTRKRT